MKNFVSQRKIKELSDSIETTTITILQGPCGSSKTYTLKSLFKTEYIENPNIFRSFVGNPIAHTEIETKEEIFKFIKKIYNKEINVNKIVIETRTTIGQIELNEFINKYCRKEEEYFEESFFDFSSTDNYSKCENKIISCNIVNFNKISDNKIKKYTKKYELVNGNLHKFFLLDYSNQRDESVSFYHFLGKILYSNDKSKINEIKNVNFDEKRIISYLRQNCIYFLDNEKLFEFIELISECYDNYLVLIYYLFETDKIRPGNFYGFKSLTEGEKNKKMMFF